MLSLFPSLFTWSFFGIAFLRVVLALVLGAHAWEHLKDARSAKVAGAMILGLIEAILALLLLIGLFTQVAALLLAVLMIASLVLKYQHRDNLPIGLQNHYPPVYYVLIAAIALSLLVLGPGAWAIDWPL
jgi:uncharacterized membrane protein YphA (DoxX/SURF4 family)